MLARCSSVQTRSRINARARRGGRFEPNVPATTGRYMKLEGGIAPIDHHLGAGDETGFVTGKK